MAKYILLSMVLLSLCLTGTAVAADESGGAIDGRVINGTQDGGGVGQLELTLYSYQGGKETEAATTLTDSNGNFTFENLSVLAENEYQVKVAFQEAEYTSDFLNFAGGETIIPVDITVYDATTSDEAINIGMAHTVVYLEEGSLQIKDYFIFINKSDRTFIGTDEGAMDGERKTLLFPLPEGAHNLQPSVGLMECCIITDESGFAYSMPVLPGYAEVAYTYTLHYDSDEYPLSYQVNYPMVRYDLLLQSEDIQVKDTELVEEEPMNINGAVFNHLSGENYLPGDVISARLSNLGSGSGALPVVWIVLGAFVIGVGIAVYYQGRKSRGKPVAVESDDQQALLQELAGLDDDFADGKIPEDEYRKRRAEKKAEITSLMQRK